MYACMSSMNDHSEMAAMPRSMRVEKRMPGCQVEFQIRILGKADLH